MSKKDVILEMFFEPSRWEHALNKGVDKDINRKELQRIATPELRIAMKRRIEEGKYAIAPPHTAKIPKETPGEFRTVYVNEPIDRLFLSIANDLLIDLTPGATHPSCKSYTKGISCGKIVQGLSKRVRSQKGEIIGFKSDLSKYFDSVPLEFIDKAFDMVEDKHGKSAVIDVVRKYYHSDLYFDEDGNLCESYQSLKQGCSVASWLANVLLYHIDSKLSSLKGYYTRYSDDMLYIGEDYEQAMDILTSELEKMQMKLNPKKVEYLTHKSYFRFLGFAVRDECISLYKTHVKNFQKEIEKRTIKRKNITLRQAINAVNNYLYRGNGEHSWADQVLPFCNVESDLLELDKFVMDCFRAVVTKKTKVGGLGYVPTKDGGCIVRGIGRNVKANRAKTGDTIDGYLTLGAMRKARVTSHALYNTLVNTL